MYNELLKKWFLDKMYSCYPVKHDNYPGSIFWFYDESFIRNIKLSRINGSDIKLPTNVKGVCLFEQVPKNEELYCNYEHIWSVFEKYGISKYDDIQSFIINILKDESRLNVYTPKLLWLTTQKILNDESNISVYLPRQQYGYPPQGILECLNKLHVYTSDTETNISTI